MSWRLLKLMRFIDNQHKNIKNENNFNQHFIFLSKKTIKICSFLNDSSQIIPTGEKSIFTLKYAVIFVVFSIASNTRGKKRIPHGPQQVEVIKNDIAERICIILVRNRFPDVSQILTVCGVAFFLNSKTEDRQTR